MSYSDTQLKRLYNWAQGNVPVGWGDDGLPELLADMNGGTNGPRQVVQSLLRHIEETERAFRSAVKDTDAALEAKKRATSTRIDETARAMLVALYNRRLDLTKGDCAKEAYLWASILEEAREEKT